MNKFFYANPCHETKNEFWSLSIINYKGTITYLDDKSKATIYDLNHTYIEAIKE